MPADAQTACDKCPAGYFAGRGSKFCTACPLGRFSNGLALASKNCRSGICPPGKFSIGRAKACSTCDDHEFQKRTGQSSCMVCTTPVMGMTVSGRVRYIALVLPFSSLHPALSRHSTNPAIRSREIEPRLMWPTLCGRNCVQERTSTRGRSTRRRHSVLTVMVMASINWSTS
jgi:hypothetical protein